MNSGPSLTMAEIMKGEDPGLEAWLQGLSNRTNASRKAIVEIICPATFASTSREERYPDIAMQLLMACNSDTQRRERMLQTPFLNGQTPIAWVICNIPNSLLTGQALLEMPHILSVLFECCEARTPAAMSALPGVLEACCIRNTNQLFQLLNPLANPSGTPVYSITLSSSWTDQDNFDFTIPDFPTRMLIEGRIDMRFISKSRLFSIGFSVEEAGQWVLFHNILLDFSQTYRPRYIIIIDLAEMEGRHIPYVAGPSHLLCL
ncbi:hypothetical protein BKA70DRAFT_1287478 [Coprinopsis sp. MPI-PUGE-AT-0042]|nr:hypothetical protein BKA70DRAFT_1287478 [Coprinopsis sp. MPI-PUGE-AT-0042]